MSAAPKDAPTSGPAGEYASTLYQGIGPEVEAFTGVHRKTSNGGYLPIVLRAVQQPALLAADVARHPNAPYWRVCPVPGDIDISKGRGTAADSIALPALWADMDREGPGHGEYDRLPLLRSWEDAEAIFARAGVPQPTMHVNSGGGDYPFWVLKPAWVFASNEEWSRARTMVKRFNRLLIDRGAELGFHVDEVGDLSRVLRPPGSIRAKDGCDPFVVELIYSDGPTYTIEEVQSWLPPEPPPKPRAARTSSKHLSEGLRLIVQTYEERLADFTKMPPASGRHDRLLRDMPWAGARLDYLEEAGIDPERDYMDAAEANGHLRSQGRATVEKTIVGGLDLGRDTPYHLPPLKNESQSAADRFEADLKVIIGRRGATDSEGDGRRGAPPQDDDGPCTSEAPPGSPGPNRPSGGHGPRRGTALTDMGNAERLVIQHGHHLRYSHKWKRWLCWDGRRWADDYHGGAEARAKRTARSIYAEAAEEEDDKVRKALIKHAIDSEKASRIGAMLKLAESEEGIPAAPDAFDRDLNLLNLRNGTLDLRNGKVKPPDPADLITKLIDIDYLPGTPCPRWMTFLDKVMGGDEALITYLQLAAGYSLTGSTVEQCIFILFGHGQNGKSTFLTLLRQMLGEYAQNAPEKFLIDRKEKDIPNDIARLRGARFVTALETEDGGKLSEAMVKKLTGGDPLTGCFKYGEYFDFEPSAKFWMGTNHKPDITGTDKAIWRRVRLVPFTVTIADSEKDLDFIDKLRTELPGILAWAVEGALRWQRERLTTPKTIGDATEDYRRESDVLGTFLEDQCVIESNAKVEKQTLYAHYVTWCEKSGQKARKKVEIDRSMTERGFEAASRCGKGGHVSWDGVGMKDLGQRWSDL